jgi:hypothetical protein
MRSEKMSGRDVVDQPLTEPASLGERNSDQVSTKIEGVVLGLLVGLTDAVTPLVSFSGNPTSEAIRARAIVALKARDVGRQVALLFEEGDPGRPLVIGCIHSPTAASMMQADLVEAEMDGECVLLTAKQQLVLRCGKASITLTQAGKVLISGTYVVSRSSGVNRLRGGSIELN